MLFINIDDAFKYKPSSKSKYKSKLSKPNTKPQHDKDYAISNNINTKLKNRPSRGNNYTFEEETKSKVGNSNSNSKSIDNSNDVQPKR